jgi:hypothetical protein
MSKYTPPYGYQANPSNASLWNVGHVFVWSPVFQRWVDRRNMITVRPDETCREALKREGIEPIQDVKVFFVKD